MALDHDRLVAFLNRFVGDLGATMAAVSVVIGDRLGFYQELAAGALSAEELAHRTGTAPGYVEEWLRGQAASGYVEYDEEAATFRLTAEQAFALTDPDGAVYVPGAFHLALTALRAIPQITQAFRTGSVTERDELTSSCRVGATRLTRVQDPTSEAARSTWPMGIMATE